MLVLRLRQKTRSMSPFTEVAGTLGQHVMYQRWDSFGFVSDRQRARYHVPSLVLLVRWSSHLSAPNWHRSLGPHQRENSSTICENFF